jgi:transaldolase/glucose-6-phosphate isomerase
MNSKKNPLKELARFGQSPWYDNVSRALLQSGALRRMIEEDGLRGITSNPTIFEKAISSGEGYEQSLLDCARRGETAPAKVFEKLATDDIRQACDFLKPVHEETKGEDGFVSIEVSPELARDTEASVAEARRLSRTIGRPNLMVKIPATREGIPAIERLIADGVSVNVTLIFSNDRYGEVMEAYLAGLEKRSREGLDISRVSSVASFFVSRIDTAVDKEINALMSRKPTGDGAEFKGLLGKTAIANAKMAYERFKETFQADRFKALEAKGARAQRPLWASTGTKNPAYGDVYYVEALIGSGTVNTIPPATWDAFRDHGRLAMTVEEGLGSARDHLAKIGEAGISLAKVTEKLEEEGVKAFADSYHTLLATISARLKSVAAA